jgi:hypothetical protein
MSGSLTEEDRRNRARAAAYAKHAKHDPRPTVAKANRAFVDSFLLKVDPTGELDPQERARRRVQQLRARGEIVDYDKILNQIVARHLAAQAERLEPVKH